MKEHYLPHCLSIDNNRKREADTTRSQIVYDIFCKFVLTKNPKPYFPLFKLPLNKRMYAAKTSVASQNITI